jgi:hypothetical protein
MASLAVLLSLFMGKDPSLADAADGQVQPICIKAPHQQPGRKVLAGGQPHIMD